MKKKMKVMDVKKSIRTSFHFMIIVLASFNVVYSNHFDIMQLLHVALKYDKKWKEQFMAINRDFIIQFSVFTTYRDFSNG